MIIFGMPLAAWLGMLIFIAICVQIYLGVSMMKGKPVLKYHKFNAGIILILAILHPNIFFLSS